MQTVVVYRYEKLEFFEMMLSKFPQFSTEQLLETSESEDPDFLGSLSAQNPGTYCNFSISGRPFIDFLVAPDFLERHW